MSGAVQSLAWAMSIRGIDASSFRVLIALVNRANHRTGECYPSHRLIADDAEMSVATVKRCLERLVEKKLVTVHPQKRDNGGDSVNRYRLTVAQNELPPAQNELPPQLNGELPNRTRNKEHTSRAKALSVARARKPETDFDNSGLAVSEACGWALAEMGWSPGQATMEFVRFKDHAAANDVRYRNWMAAWRNWCRSPYCHTKSSEDRTAYRREPLRV